MLTELPYHPDTPALFAPLAQRPWALFLDSGRPHADAGRWDLIVADPSATLVTRGAVTELRHRGGASVRSGRDPFALLREALAPCAEPLPGLPFRGGAVGWFGYDLARRIERLPVRAADAEGLPEMAVGVYDWALAVDHQQERSWLVGTGRDPLTARRWMQLVARFSRAPRAVAAESALHAVGALGANLSRAEYGRAFRRVQHYIRAGDCYQVNLAQRFSARAGGDAWAGYRRLRRLNPGPFSAFLQTPFAEVLCSSPERFLALREGRVETRPIKGTRARGASAAEDAAQARALAASAKDRAENLMIVDLLRNDLGRVCRPGSVRVPELFKVEPYATVHHLVSTVTGELDTGADAAALLRACFPGGSITGAPKIRAMEIIEALEPHRRGLYCGAIGYLGFDGDMDTNIAIRTLVHSGGEVRLWAGGGLVHDSDEEQEYRETLDKAKPLLALLGAGVREAAGGPR